MNFLSLISHLAAVALTSFAWWARQHFSDRRERSRIEFELRALHLALGQWVAELGHQAGDVLLGANAVLRAMSRVAELRSLFATAMDHRVSLAIHAVSESLDVFRAVDEQERNSQDRDLFAWRNTMRPRLREKASAARLAIEQILDGKRHP